MAEYPDRVKETTTTTGTGTITLAGAVSGYRAMSGVVTDGAYVPYIIEASDGGWETGYGLFTATGTTLARSFIKSSSNSGAAITLPAGTHTVSVGFIGHMAGYRGAIVYNSADQSIPDFTLTALEFNSETSDSDGFHDLVTNNSRLTVPDWVSNVRLTGGVTFAANNAGLRSVQTRKNGGYTALHMAVSGPPSNSDLNITFGLISGIVSVSPGDYFELVVRQTSGAALNVTVGGTWFNIEVIA